MRGSGEPNVTELACKALTQATYPNSSGRALSEARHTVRVAERRA